jgi:hypothetical protein
LFSHHGFNEKLCSENSSVVLSSMSRLQIFWIYGPRKEITGLSSSSIFVFLRNLHTICILVISFNLHKQCTNVPQYHQHLSSFFNNNHPKRCEKIPYFHFNLHYRRVMFSTFSYTWMSSFSCFLCRHTYFKSFIYFLYWNI